MPALEALLGSAEDYDPTYRHDSLELIAVRKCAAIPFCLYCHSILSLLPFHSVSIAILSLAFQSACDVPSYSHVSFSSRFVTLFASDTFQAPPGTIAVNSIIDTSYCINNVYIYNTIIIIKCSRSKHGNHSRKLKIVSYAKISSGQTR